MKAGKISGATRSENSANRAQETREGGIDGR
jgi:hypothetical protein